MPERYCPDVDYLGTYTSIIVLESLFMAYVPPTDRPSNQSDVHPGPDIYSTRWPLLLWRATIVIDPRTLPTGRRKRVCQECMPSLRTLDGWNTEYATVMVGREQSDYRTFVCVGDGFHRVVS